MTDVIMKLGSLLSVTWRHHSVQARTVDSMLGRCGVMETALVYLLFQLTKNADSYGIVQYSESL